MKKDMDLDIEIPQGVEVKIDDTLVIVKGEKGENKRKFAIKKINISVSRNNVKLAAKDATQREKRMMNTIAAHIRNMVHGAKTGFTYKLKICSSHFPMTVKNDNNKIVVKNFLGEAKERTLNIKENVDAKIEGDFITITSSDKELAGQAAGSIEKICRITNRDRRIFQDGIYITEKPKRLDIIENE